MSSQNRGPAPVALTPDELLAMRVRDALWHAFPEAVSEHDLAQMAREFFRNARTGQPIDEKTIRNWLRMSVMPSADHMVVLIGMVGTAWFRLPQKGWRT